MKNEVIVKYNEILESILIKYLFVEDIDEILYLSTKRYEEIEKINKAKNCDDKNICSDKKKKKSKINIEKEICAYTKNEELIKALKDFWEMRNNIQKPFKTVNALTRLFNKLDKLSGNNDNVKVEILEKSILNNWQDIWELKSDNSYKKTDENTQKRKNYCENVNTPTLKGQELEDTILANNDLDKF
ncbi:hypothetical protein HMPREF1143_1995 [Peptoanaerobacter stomatis]|uniref:Uncharacterized protein n=1 Tax=Peptoanaerobacter stomatis TaxID=796937 RepID=J4W5C7_9FIRM|nr:hypothetical protein [Peptoanaerobacter stomatis]EJU21176.1 hypothetical protein HMPREF1143_1995 [Peptoanaerobacter stomatis]